MGGVASRETYVALCSRNSILELQDCIAECEQINPHVDHFFASGMYARQIYMAAGDLVVGKIHKHDHINTISQGRVLVTTEFGKDEFVAPYTFVSKAGTKRAVFVLEDTIWTTYHATESTSLEQIEEEIIAPDFASFDLLELKL